VVLEAPNENGTVSVPEQVAVVELTLVRVHKVGKLNRPLVRPKPGVTVPVGVVAPIAEASLTYTVHVVG